MIIHNETLISDDILGEFFACDIRMCKGVCCVQGDAGAPLESSEVEHIERNLDLILTELDDVHRKFILENGFYEKDHDGELVTKCLDNGECCFVKEGANGVLGCGMENAHFNGKTDFIKPISCHLYPVRIKNFSTYTALNYHKWELCSPACDKGTKNGVKVYQFVEKALRRRFGDVWYEDLVEIAESNPPISR
jgi:hypothetical protein